MAKKSSKTDNDTTLQDLRDAVEHFSTERNWVNNDPKQLLLSAFIELGELAEHYQWSSDGAWQTRANKKKEIAYELVDVFFYLLRFINKSDFDFSSNFYQKTEKLAKKYPANLKTNEEYQQAKDSYRRSGKKKLYD